jgi:hypothetical protein
MKQRLKYSHKTIENFVKKYIKKEYKIKENGEIAVNSPFREDTSFDLKINIEKQCWNEWGTPKEDDEPNTIVKLVKLVCNVEDREAEDILLACAGSTKLNFYTPIVKKKESYEIKAIEKPPYCFSFINNEGDFFYRNKAINFLKKKNVKYSLAKKYDLGWTERSRIYDLNFDFRIIIPTYENERLVYFQARTFKNRPGTLPYLNIPANVQPKTCILPFYDLLKSNEPLFISEGCWEAILYGGTYMLGPIISPEQVVKIRNLNPKDIYLIPDNDTTGKRTLADNILMLNKSAIRCNVYIINWWSGEFSKFKDPTDAKINDITTFPIIKADRNIYLKLKLGQI